MTEDESNDDSLKLVIQEKKHENVKNVMHQCMESLEQKMTIFHIYKSVSGEPNESNMNI